MKNKESGQEYSNNLEVIEMKLKEKLDKNISEESKNSSMKLVSKKGYQLFYHKKQMIWRQ